MLTNSGTIRGLHADHNGSDHLAIGTSFRPGADAKPGRQRIPRWLASDALFAPTFDALWTEGDACEDPFEELARLKSTFYETKSVILASRATVKGYKLDALGQLSIGIKLLRLEAKGLLSGPRSRSYVSKYAFLPQLCGASGNIDPALLRAHVDGLFSAHGTPFPDIDDDTHLGG